MQCFCLLYMLDFCWMELVDQKPSIFSKATSSSCCCLQHLLRELADNLFDQSKMQQIVMLRVKHYLYNLPQGITHLPRITPWQYTLLPRYRILRPISSPITPLEHDTAWY